MRQDEEDEKGSEYSRINDEERKEGRNRSDYNQTATITRVTE